MNDSQDTMDRLLRGYASRWREAQPPPPTVGIARLVARRPPRPRSALFHGHTARWLPVVTVAAAVALLAAGVAFVRQVAAPPRPPVASPSPTLSAGVVPWAPLAATGVTLPTQTLPASPDPAKAEGLPPCRADQLRVEPSFGAATGTRYLTLLFRATGTTTCRLGGRPTVTVLGGGRQLPVPVDTTPSSADYAAPVAVSADQPVTLTLSWTSNWCDTPVDNDGLSLALPDGGGTLTTVGFGGSACYGEPGGGTRAPIRVGTFQPPEFTPERQVTVFDGVSAQIAVPVEGTASGRLRFTVILTAPASRNVPLDPCPDYAVTVSVRTDSTNASYALNCAAVPHRDGAGRPYLPAGVPVRFGMEADVPAGASGDAKLVWQLVLPVMDSVAASSVVPIR